jgi:hypothetical protein
MVFMFNVSLKKNIERSINQNPTRQITKRRTSNMATINVGMMTSGGLAPCLSSSIAHLVSYWGAAKRDGKIAGLTIRMYRDGYKGILLGDSFLVSEEAWDAVDSLHELGGSPIGNSRVKVRYVLNLQLMHLETTSHLSDRQQMPMQLQEPFPKI